MLTTVPHQYLGIVADATKATSEISYA